MERVPCNAACADGSIPLNTAACRHETEMVSLLCLKGADVDKVDARGRTPLQLAALLGHAAAARALLAGGAGATFRNGGGGLEMLDRAAVRGHVGVLMAIIEHGVDVNDADDRISPPNMLPQVPTRRRRSRCLLELAPTSKRGWRETATLLPWLLLSD